jgi:hypothetical protein
VKPLIFLLAAAMCTSAVQAQLSPGELHKSHAFLEGMDNCGKCHSSDRSNLSNQCLQCHTAIKERQDAGRGLHGSAKYRDCEMCHVEHHGRDFDLIYFEGGVEAFDHAATGYTLIGRHADLTCRKCHRPEHIADPEGLKEQSVAIDRTYLGLSTECLSCHLDQHRGQLSNDCAKCHGFTAWRPANGFDHASTAYPLSGRHISVECSKCHVQVADEMIAGSPSYAKYRPVAHNQCTDCHRDVHEGRLGANCSGCHSTSGWKQVQSADFDHDRTRYPLRGRHAAVECRQCHTNASTGKKLKFARCMDCHSDFHRGDFAARPQAGACEECHTVQGFSPALFTLDLHERTDYPLQGAHRAIPCGECHRSLQANEIHYRFKFANTDCRQCHRDPHKGQLDKFLTTDGCESCHTVQTWSESKFDHSQTDFALTGRHKMVACTGCHFEDAGAETRKVAFVKLQQNCESCHRDIHGGQFIMADQSGTACDRCHTTDNWQPSRFEHSRDSRFVLDGAHARIACVACHKDKVKLDDDMLMVRYKPLDTACVSCHAEGTLTGKAKL